ncbi:hypothetical protein C8T65DRAFT_653746 [Cerioporus squamosus]|nr:hypothetical protein C8T65DRAFT_653746 [Cerioporus squamosus]
MSSIFPGRRKLQRPVPTANDHDPWGMRDSTPSAEDAPSTSNTRAAAARLMHSMRKFSYSTPRKREREHSDGHMYSTPAESSPPTPSAYNFHDRPDTRPTIEQIAMGLHISRTPHLIPQRSSSSPHIHNHPHHHNRRSVDSPRVHSQPLLTRPTMHTRRASTSAVVLPPPPPRSSLKKPSRPPTMESVTLAPSASDASLSTLATQTSNGPATPRSAQSAPATSFPGKLRFEMLKLLPSRKGSLSSTDSTRSDSPSVMTPSSDADSLSGGLTPRKSVRFSPGPDTEVS